MAQEWSSSTLPYNLQEEVGKRVITEILEKVPGFKVMCVDNFSKRIVGSCLKLSDVGDLGVTTVENLMIEREPLPSLDCIYFVEPTGESWERIKNDFRDKSNPMYQKAHLFFTSKVPDSLFAQIKQQPNLLARLGSFVEVNIEFLSCEPQIFTTCMPVRVPTGSRRTTALSEWQTRCAGVAQGVVASPRRPRGEGTD